MCSEYCLWEGAEFPPRWLASFASRLWALLRPRPSPGLHEDAAGFSGRCWYQSRPSLASRLSCRSRHALHTETVRLEGFARCGGS